MRTFLLFLWVVQGYAAFNLTWGTPAISLDSNPPIGDTDCNVSIAADPMGNAIAVWSRTVDQGASEDVWTAVYSHASRIWTGPIKISGGGSASSPHVSMDGESNAIVVWVEGFPTQVMSRVLTSQGVWSPDLSSPATHIYESKNAQNSPQIALDSSGNATLIWMEFNGKNDQLYSAKKPFRLPWIPLGPLSSGLKTVTLTPGKALVMNEQGNAIAVWKESDGAFSEIHAAQFIQGSWNPSVSIFAEEKKSPEFPAAGLDQNNRAILVWGLDQAIYSKTWIDGIVSPTPLLVSDLNHPSFHPDIGVDSNGNAVVVYERYNAMHKFIAGTTLPFNGTSWSEPVDISGPSPIEAAAAGYPILSINSIGDGVVIWKEQTETNMIIQGAGYSLGTWSLTKTLSSLDSNSACSSTYDMAVAVNRTGNIMAVWPEDPTKRGTFQIKAVSGVGLAVAGPLPPKTDPVSIQSGIAYGTQVSHRFPAHTDLINILTWTPRKEVAYYNIYRGGLSSLVGNATRARFEDHQRIPKKKETYLITSVDRHGQESTPITIVVSPL